MGPEFVSIPCFPAESLLANLDVQAGFRTAKTTMLKELYGPAWAKENFGLSCIFFAAQDGSGAARCMDSASESELCCSGKYKAPATSCFGGQLL